MWDGGGHGALSSLTGCRVVVLQNILQEKKIIAAILKKGEVSERSSMDSSAACDQLPLGGLSLAQTLRAGARPAPGPVKEPDAGPVAWAMKAFPGAEHARAAPGWPGFAMKGMETVVGAVGRMALAAGPRASSGCLHQGYVQYGCVLLSVCTTIYICPVALPRPCCSPPAPSSRESPHKAKLSGNGKGH